MPVQTNCPHCATPCLIGEQHITQLVRCFACGQIFRLQGAAAPPVHEAPSTFDDLPMPFFDAEPSKTKRWSLDIGSMTTAGRARPCNEDAYLIRRQAWAGPDNPTELILLAVGDGMGGYGGGAHASALGVRSIQAALSPFFDSVLTGQIRPEQAAADQLRAALNKASQAVYAAAQSDGRFKGMGAAVVAALLWQHKAVIGHVGDCRAYHFRQSKLQQATKDQTLVQRMLDLGTLKPHEAKHHPAKNELSQAIGRRPDVVADICQVSLARGDWLILACDGLEEHLDHDDLRREIELALPSACFLADRLIDVANERGGKDNCTVITVHVL